MDNIHKYPNYLKELGIQQAVRNRREHAQKPPLEIVKNREFVAFSCENAHQPQRLRQETVKNFSLSWSRCERSELRTEKAAGCLIKGNSNSQ